MLFIFIVCFSFIYIYIDSRTEIGHPHRFITAEGLTNSSQDLLSFFQKARRSEMPSASMGLTLATGRLSDRFKTRSVEDKSLETCCKPLETSMSSSVFILFFIFLHGVQW